MSSNALNTPSKLSKSTLLSEASPILAKKSSKNQSRTSNSRGSCNTPGRSESKRVSSFNKGSFSLCTSPNKSRLDYTSAPYVSVDLKACQDDIQRVQIEHKKQALAEKRVMREEWIAAKKNFKMSLERKTFEHEEFLTSNRLELRKMEKEQQKNKKICERDEKILDFFELKEAKRKLREEEKKRELEEMNREREKIVLRQREVEEKKMREKMERDEKRKAFLEKREVEKQVEVEERLREKRELEFQYAQEIAGKRKVLMESFESQRNTLMKVEMVLNN